MRLTSLFLLGCCLCSFAARAQARESRVDLSCVTALELPTHGLLAARAPRSGTVHATIEIGPGGDISRINFASDSPTLEGEVRVALNLSRFSQHCAGRSVDFVFSFTLEDPPTDYILPPSTRFVPPNRFEFIFRRVKASVDPSSSKPKP